MAASPTPITHPTLAADTVSALTEATHRRRFDYGGYSFGFIDPWPVGWGYADDVYVVYDDGGYFMYNRYHPGFRISLNIL